MDIPAWTNAEIATELEQLALEITAKLKPNQSLRSLAIGIASAAILRTVRELRNPKTRQFIEEIPELYDLAREACHAVGLPWTDPRTGVTHPPNKKPH